MIFVDTSFWVGLTAELDDRHPAALALLTECSEPLLTSNQVVGETWTFLRHRYRHDIAMAFLDRAENDDDLEIVHATQGLERDAWTWLRHHDERPYSFVDATSFALMRHLKIREAFAFDGDFTAAGFVELRT